MSQLAISVITLFFLLLSATTDISIQQQTNHVYNWGRNLDSELGILLENSIPLPKHLPNIEAKLKSIDSTGFYNDSNIQIIQGYKFTYFISNSFDNNTQKFIEYSKLLGCGYNGDFSLGIHTPIIVSDPIPPYRYTPIGEDYGNYKNFNNLYGKTIRFMSCSLTCLMVANNGLVYSHNTGANDFLDYYLVSILPTMAIIPEISPQVTIQLNYTKVAVCGTGLGKETFFALTDNGYLYVWGGSMDNSFVTRGDANPTTGLALLSLRNVIDIYCKDDLIVAIRADNKLFFWGIFQGLNYFNPTIFTTEAFQNDKIIKVKNSGVHILVLTENGMVYGVGYNSQGQVLTGLGAGNLNDFVNVTYAIAGGQKRIKDIYVGGTTSSGALTEDNLLYTWGSGNIGRTGGSLPQLIALPEDDNKVLHASISNEFGFVLTTNRKAYGFGNNYDSLVCDGSLKISSSPLKLTNSSDSNVIEFNNNENKTAIQIVSGQFHTLLLLGDGSLYIWGRCFSRMSTIPDGSADINLPPTLLPSSLFNGEKIISVDSKNVHIAVLTSNGNVYTWGDAANYKLGNKNNQGAVATPFKVNLPIPAKAIAVGSQHTMILLNNGSLIGVGSNDVGQLGIGYLSASEVDFKLADTSAIPTNDDIIQITCTQSTSYIVTRSGRLYSTGENTEGVANGIAEPSNIKQFTQVTSISGRVTKIITGADRSAFVIAVDGRAFNLNVGVSQITLPDSSDQFVVNGAVSYYNAFVITSKRNVYGRGGNNAFQISNDNTVISSSSMIKYNGNINGEIPYLISITSGSSAATSIQLVTVKEYQCFGKNSTDFSKVCSGHGICLSENVCQCFSPYSGDDCSVACFGKSKDDSTVCSGHGQCIGLDKCQCNQGYFGDKCQYVSCYGNEEKFGYSNRLCLKINNVLLNNH